MPVDCSEVRVLARDFTVLGRNVLDVAAQVVTKVAADTVTDAQAVVPVRTGNLRASISYDVTRSAGSVAAEVGPTANYGRHVEFGTSRMGPKPYMVPAFNRQRDVFVRVMGQMEASP